MAEVAAPGSPRTANIDRKDWALAALLGLLTVALRLPFLSRYLFIWDSVNFALALEHFDVTQHRPHPPGYFYYVGLGRLLNALFNDANLSLALESVLLSALAVAALYLLGRAMFSRRSGLMAALLLVFSVTFWTYGEIALSYPALAFFSILVAYLTYRVLFHDERGLVVWVAVAYAIGGGFRPDLLLFLAPLWLASLTRASRLQAVASVLVALGGFLAWLLPTVLLSGGLVEYGRAFAAYFSVDVVERYAPTHRGLLGLGVNIRDTASYLFYALYAEAVLLVLALGWVALSKRRWWNPKALFLTGWIAPMLLFYILLHQGEPGYIFSLLPAFLLVTARFLDRVRWPLLPTRAATVVNYALLAVVLAANTGIFFLHPRLLTYQGLVRNDQHLGNTIAYVQTTHTPQEVVLLSYQSYKHWMYYLPAYPHNLWVDLFSRQERHFPIPNGVHTVLLTDQSLLRILDPKLGYQPVALGEDLFLYRLEVRPGQRLRYSGSLITLE